MSETELLFKPGEMPTGPRPVPYSEAILTGTLEALIPRVVEWLGDSYRPSEHDEIVKQLRETLEHGVEEDGYHLARSLDRTHHWECDSELVEILEDVWFTASRLHDEAVRRWVADSGIKPALAMGQEVTVTIHGRAPARGTIRDIRMPTGQYTVHVPEHGHKVSTFKGSDHYGGWIVDWEKLEAEQRLNPDVREPNA